mmetsp:Transcript_37776/g.62537  ORF Transcript_37776/g.62537 Transcript_37776/m.62537 type:complete len:83 (+) Transcript_37776:2-250(+)
MDNLERAQFLSFVTACPHLPPVGLAALTISVQQQAPGLAKPTARTCTATLWLPAYDTAEQLAAGLREAFANIEAGGVHEHGS